MILSGIIPMIQNLTEGSQSQPLDSKPYRDHPALNKLFTLIEKTEDRFNRSVRGTLYYSDNSNKRWINIYRESENIFRNSDAADSEINNLNKTLSNRIHINTDMFFTQSEHTSVYFKIPLSNDKYNYVVKVDVNRQGLASFIKNDFDQFIIFGIVILIISFILGQFFSWRIIKPIKSLSETASERASGKTGAVFTVNRRDEIGDLSRSLNIMSAKIDSHMAEIDRRMRTMDTMNMIDKAVLSSVSRKNLLDRVIGLVSDLFNSSSIALALYNREEKGFEILSVYHDNIKGILNETPFVPLESLDSGHAANIRELYEFTCGDAVCRAGELYSHFHGRIINVPIHLGGTYLGSVIVGKDDAGNFPPETVESITMLADQVGIALHSVREFEEKEKIFLGILIALTRAIDAKSKWTSGHSERVAQYSEEIGIRLNLPEQEIRVLTISAILHDIGKIGVSEIILDKPARLSDEEFDVIKTHPREGARIVSDIPAYDKILPGILYHHEHWDGGGYPEGLKGADIPLNSRIITIADVFDAITADRPYRKGINPDEAITFLKNNNSVLFDPDIVKIFIEMVEEKKDSIKKT